MIAIRDGFAQTLTVSLKECESSKPPAAAASNAPSASQAEVVELRAENKKLKYRVSHLLKTIDEVESATK